MSSKNFIRAQSLISFCSLGLRGCDAGKSISCVKKAIQKENRFKKGTEIFSRRRTGNILKFRGPHLHQDPNWSWGNRIYPIAL